MRILHYYETMAKVAARYSGRPITFIMAVSLVVMWAISGPIFDYSDTWQLVINTGTTIITFLMVFLIQHTQTADTIAIQLKLDELIRAKKEADNFVIDLEDLDEEALEEIRKKYQAIAIEAREASKMKKDLEIDKD